MATSKKSRVHRTESQLRGRKFGLLTVLRETTGLQDTARYMDCICECGTEKPIRLANLIQGNTKSCGCSSKRNRTIKVNPGEVFGRLTVIKEIDRCGVPLRRAVSVKCSCGVETWVFLNNMVQGQVKSCGCLKDDYIDSITVYRADATPTEVVELREQLEAEREAVAPARAQQVVDDLRRQLAEAEKKLEGK